MYNDGSTGEHIPVPGQITVTFIPAGQGIAFLSIHSKEGQLLESWGCSSTFPEPCTVKAFQIPAYVKLTVSVNPKITTDVKVLYVHE